MPRLVTIALLVSALLSACASTHSARPLETRVFRLTLPSLSGGQATISSSPRQLIALTLFTTWCIRCQAEAPLWVRLDENFRRRGLQVVGVALDDNPASLIKTYVDYVGFRFPILLSRPEDVELVSAIGQTATVPRTLLIDGNGRVVLEQIGQTDFPALTAAMESRLPENVKLMPKTRAAAH